MLKVDAITFFGSKTKLANAAGVRLASVAAWGIPSLDNLRQASLLRTPTASVPHIPATHLEVTCGYYFDLFWYRNSGW